MKNPPRPLPSVDSLTLQQRLGLGFLFWLAVVVMLEPRNILIALDAGVTPHWGREAIRLLAAALLGAASTPVLVTLVQRFPLDHRGRIPGFVIQAVAIGILAPSLILVSCVLAAWGFENRFLPRLAEVQDQLTANLLLLIVCLSLFLILLQPWSRSGQIKRLKDATEPWPRSLVIKDRNRITVLDLDLVEWIETQGNYQALHTGGQEHLLRDTSERLEARLDPKLFVRIHRRTIVAVAQIHTLEPLPNGDGIIRLKTGAILRMSRSHRASLQKRLADLARDFPRDEIEKTPSARRHRDTAPHTD